MSTFREIIKSTPYKEQSHVLELVINQDGDSYVLENVVKLIGSYTFSIWTKANKNCSVQFDVLGTIKIAEVTTDWKKYVYTVKTDDLSNGKSIAIQPDNNTTTYYYEGFLSEGTIDNSWLPAPEDGETQMESVKSEFIQKADSIEEKVTANDGKISSLIVDVNGIRGKIANAEGAISELQQTASSLSSSISDNKQNISKLEQQANEFSVSVSKTYATKQEMNAAIKVQSDSITQSVKQQIDNIEVGGRNLLLDTQTGINKTGTGQSNETSSEYLYSNYGKNNLHNGSQKEFVISYDWKTSDATYGTIEMQSCFSNIQSFGKTEITSVKKSGHVVDVVQIPANWNGSSNTGVRFRLSGVYGTVYFSNVKLEIGNKATNWSSAPEDVDDNIRDAQISADKAKDAATNAQNKAESNENRITISESSIKMLSDKICSIVTDSSGSSVLTQTSSGFEFNLSAIEKNINKAANDLNDLSGTVNEVDNIVNNLNKVVDDLGKKTAYIVMTTDDDGNPCIELGKEDNPFKVRITNTSVDFLEGSSRIAYVNNKALYIEKAVIKNELQIGDKVGFIWATRSNGNMGLRKIG